MEGPESQIEMPAGLMPFDRLASARVPPGDLRDARARALAGGVSLEIPLADEVDIALLYASDAMDDAAVQRIVGPNLIPQSISFGALEAPWIGNLTRMGTASASLGTLFSADIMLLQEQAMQFVRCIPAMREMEVEATEFNRKHASIFAQIRDFVILPFALNQRSEPLWSAMRECTLPENAAPASRPVSQSRSLCDF